MVKSLCFQKSTVSETCCNKKEWKYIPKREGKIKKKRAKAAELVYATSKIIDKPIYLQY